MATDTTVKQLIVNTLTQAEYEAITSPSDTEFYLTPDTTAQEISSAIATHNSNASAHSDIRSAVNAKIPTNQKAVANGVATLDGNGKVPLSQMNDAVLGNVSYQGTWDAATNDPFLIDPSGGLPTGYQALDYIEITNNNRGAYIDTGLIFDANTTEMEYDVKASSNRTNYGWLWGAASYAVSGANNIRAGTGSIARYNALQDMYLSGGNDLQVGYAMVATGSDEHVFKVTTNRNTNVVSAWVDGVQKATGTVTGGYSTNTIYLGWIHVDDTTAGYPFCWTGKIYYFRAKKDGVLVGDFRPAIRTSDNTIGFFDLVTNTFFTNAGTGVFISGGSIEIPRGHYYITRTAGTQFGIHFEVGDWIISQGNSWGRVANTDAVASVQGRTGNVVIIDDNTGAGATGYTWSADKLTSTIPTVHNNTITITQGSQIKGTFTLNQNTDTTITLDAGGGGSSTWGSITGTLSNQTDLQTALDGKNKVFQYDTMPTGSAQFDGQIIMYTGPDLWTSVHLIPGHLYKCSPSPSATWTSTTETATVVSGTGVTAVTITDASKWVRYNSGIYKNKTEVFTRNQAHVWEDSQGNWTSVEQTSESGLQITGTPAVGDQISVTVIGSFSSYDWTDLSTASDILKSITGYTTTGTIVLKCINGVFQWVSE